MRKTIYQGDQEDLTSLSDAMVSLLASPGEHVKSASASETFPDIAQFMPDKDHFLMHLVAMGSMEKYGCVAADTPTALADGRYIPMLDVRVGDVVLSGHGRAREVTHKFEYDLETAIKLRVGGLCKDLVTSPNHPFMRASFSNFVCERDKYKRCLPPTYGAQAICGRRAECPVAAAQYPSIVSEYAAAETLRIRDFLVYQMPSVQAEESITEDEAAVIGYWLAEGSFIRNSGNKDIRALAFDFDAAERATFVEDLREVAERSGWEFHCYGPYVSSPNSLRVELNGNTARAKQYFQWFGSGAHEKHVPSWFHGLPKPVIARMLQTYFHGDGAITDGQQASATTVSVSLALGVQSLLWSVGIAATSCYHEQEIADNAWIAPGTLYKGYRVSYAYSRVPECISLLRFGHSVELEQTTKVHIFIEDGRVYLPVRAVEEIAWNDKIYTLEVAEDHSYVSANVWSKNSNRNGDGFPLKALQDYHHTFVKCGHLFREHRNTDPKLKIGIVKASAMHPRLDRAELLVWGHIKEAAEEFQMAKEGKELSYSMSCRVPDDRCNCCSNTAKNRSQYCGHLLHEMNQYLPEFQKYAFAVNDKPTFFDISRVRYPADRIAHYLQYKFPDESDLQKAASQAGVINGMDWAEYEGLVIPDDGRTSLPAKFASLAAELAQEEAWFREMIDLNWRAGDWKSNFAKEAGIRAFDGELTDDELTALRKLPPGVMFAQLAKEAASLPFRSFCAYITNKSLDEVSAEAGAASLYLPDVFTKLADHGTCVDDHSLCAPGDGDAADEDAVNKFMESVTDRFSCKAEPVRRRVFSISISFGSFGRPSMPDKKASASAAVLAEMYGLYKLAAIAANPDEYGPAQRLLMVAQNQIKVK